MFSLHDTVNLKFEFQIYLRIILNELNYVGNLVNTFHFCCHCKNVLLKYTVWILHDNLTGQ